MRFVSKVVSTLTLAMFAAAGEVNASVDSVMEDNFEYDVATFTEREDIFERISSWQASIEEQYSDVEVDEMIDMDRYAKLIEHGDVAALTDSKRPDSAKGSNVQAIESFVWL